MTRKQIIILACIVAVALFTLPLLFKDRGNEKLYKRMDEITNRLGEIQLERDDINGQIEWLNMALDDLKTEEEQLNVEVEWLIDIVMGRKKLEVETVFEEERQPWMLNASGDAQVMPLVEWEDSHQRFKNLMQTYWLDPSLIWQVENHYGIKEWVIGCITVAETSWGNRWYWKSNPGNVGNNDRWDRIQYALFETWLEKIAQTLNNQYLWSKKTLWCLSNAWSCVEEWDNGKRYATSQGNWERNMKGCLEAIYWEWTVNPSEFSVRR